MSGPNPNKKNKPDSERRQQQADRVVRVLTVHKLTQQPDWTVKSIATELGFSERTVFRDLNVLRLAGLLLPTLPAS